MQLSKITETATTITLGWTPPPGVGGYVFYAGGNPVAVASKSLKDGTARNTVKFNKTAPGPPFVVTAVCKSSGIFLLDVGTYPAPTSAVFPSTTRYPSEVMP